MAELTPKQEKFCQRYIETGNATQAYRDSYDCENMKSETINNKAYELLQKGEITARLDELRQHHQDRHDATVDEMVANLQEAYEIAKMNANPNAMISAINAKAKILGLDKSSRADIRLKELEAQIKQLEIDKIKSEMADDSDNEITINVVRAKNE
ncbi:hypothetical protein B0181_11645 [Moraxella caviae]|uniref:Terminase small subunit n=1 Tax=Moraxella caviae TaxID=34060 RepID=A0A1S9ZT05_9GAMM|nr:terminase small subunit [Moraxella caviae]OOR86645.1 hypothetical protein B0181_11645 [Moraxella caviae]STZ14508.1 Terminase small subunit [Moraxella caviae]VEW11312.1 Terminase small subunit [Moraxella caviae]